jgi:hypothetical protein
MTTTHSNTTTPTASAVTFVSLSVPNMT